MTKMQLLKEAEDLRIQIEKLENEEDIKEVTHTIISLRRKLVHNELKSKIKVMEPNPNISTYRY